MKKRIFCLAIISLFFASGLKAQTPQTALEMNNYMAGIITDVTVKANAWGVMFKEVEDSREFGILVPYRVELEKLLVSKSVELSMVQDIGGSEDFRKAMLGFLKYETDLVQQAFVPFEKINKDSKKRELKKLKKNMVSIAEKEAQVLGEVAKIQKEYAAKNGFKIGE